MVSIGVKGLRLRGSNNVIAANNGLFSCLEPKVTKSSMRIMKHSLYDLERFGIEGVGCGACLLGYGIYSQP